MVISVPISILNVIPDVFNVLYVSLYMLHDIYDVIDQIF